MKHDQPKVSIVTVNFNGTELTSALLHSLEKISYPNWEVIVVDNGSQEPCSQLMHSYPWIIYIETGANLGFAGGNNKGIQMTTGDYILLLNNDTEVATDFLEPLVNRLQGSSKIGIVSPKIMYFENPGTIQYAGFTPISHISGRGFSIGDKEKDKGQYDKARQTHRAHGAAMMFPKKALETVGLMPEVYFLYYEEMDFCEKFKRADYDIWYEPASKIWHKESMSTGKNSPLKTYFYSRNRLLYLRRNTPAKLLWITWFYFIFIAVPKNLAHYLSKKENKHFMAFWNGFVWNLYNRKTDVYDRQSS